MKTKILTFILFSGLLFSCEKEDLLPDETNRQEINELFGVRALSWVSPYIGFSQVVFESETGELDTFDLETSEIRAKGNVFTKNICQSRDIVFTSTQNPERRFTISPLGNSALYFYVHPLEDPFNPHLFRLSYSILFGEAFMVQLIYKNRDIEKYDYKYSDDYPLGADEEIEVLFNDGSNNLFKNIKMKQREGLIGYEDLNNKKWVLREIR